MKIIKLFKSENGVLVSMAAGQFLRLRLTKWVLGLILCVASFPSLAQVKISPYLMGQNAWEPGSILKVQELVKQVKYQAIRIGGNGYENEGFITKRAESLIDYARAVGAEPIVQIPRQLKDSDKAYAAIAYLNGKQGKNIKFWSIGNEPDHKNQKASPEEVYDYYTKISAQLKRYDPTAKIMGFDFSSYQPQLLDRLLGGDLDVTGKVPGQAYYYLDMVAFHNYRFVDISGFEADVKDLKQRLATFNANRPANQQIGWAITEFNSHWMVDPTLEERFLPYTFHNGQIYAEMYDLGMREGAFTISPWSIMEGGADREGTDLSMFDQIEGALYARSNYYHTQLLAHHMKATYLPHTDNQEEVKVISMGDSTGIAVMLLNKDRSNGYAYTLQLNDKKMKGKDLLINVLAGVNKKYASTLSPHSTQMLVFNSKGKLVKKYTYSEKDAEAKGAPIVCKR